MKVILGLDTSCYTTSVALVDQEGSLLADYRQLLAVPHGEKGLQQAAMIFQHLKNLPRQWEAMGREYHLRQVVGVSASTRPRPVAGSYMPVFTVSEGQGRILAATLGVPFFPTSHQEGHIMAGLWSSRTSLPGRFWVVHLSGGTSELLLVSRQANEEVLFASQLVGGTTDLHAGQMVDRVGVTLGLPFPAGPHLEKMARAGEGTSLRIPSAVRGYQFSFSGPESHARRLIASGAEPAEVARAVELCVATTLEKVLRKAIGEHGVRDVLVVGGVAANEFIRRRLQERLAARPVSARLYFADPKYSADNAVGVALIGLKLLKRRG
ncbi:hypothetical protein SY88_06970 [Clostridiales bacterium PH28_bin88]|nr:hypothetical protein SY88_06970 [Clostridiales bacterium PH28_bin88]